MRAAALIANDAYPYINHAIGKDSGSNHDGP